VTSTRRIRFCDLRLLAAAAAAMLPLHALLNPDPARKPTRLQVGGGERDVQIVSFSLSPTSAQIATTNTAGRIALRTPESGWNIEQILDFPGFATEVAFSPDGRFLAIVDRAGGLWLWELDSPMDKATKVLLASIERAKYVRYAPDGKLLAVTSDRDGTIVIWDLEAWQEQMVLYHSCPVLRMAFSPDGGMLATSGKNDRSIWVWDLEKGSRLNLVDGEPGAVVALTFSPDGTFLASAGFPEHYVCVWDLKRHEACREMAGHTRPVNSVAFSPDGSLMATAGNDGIVGLWLAATGQCLVSLDSQATCLRTVAFSPDGRSLILATQDDDHVRSWNVAELLASLGDENEHPAVAALTLDANHWLLASHHATDLTTCRQAVFGLSKRRPRSGRS
jgi:WD40 repeat protein